MPSTYQSEKFKVLVAGYINVNVIDGSAFFLAGVTSMLAGAPFVEVTLLTANPVRKTEVLDEVLFYENVSILDPYTAENRQLFTESPVGESMSRAKYAKLIGEVGQDFDSILLRDTETAYHLVREAPCLASKLSVYVTGVSDTNQDVAPELLRMMHVLANTDVRFLCQTEEMRKRIEELIPLKDDSLAVLPPHVPDAGDTFERLYHFSQRPNRFIYTGKFFKDWKTDSILAAFKSESGRGYDLKLDIAGDQFRKSEVDPYFIPNNRWLLDSTPGVHWYGRVPRRKSRALISGAHVGIGWRSEALNSSTELSTKILEYGALARPSIINRTEMHERILGPDYPLFSNSMTDFKHLLHVLPGRPDLVEEAARRCYRVSGNFSYSAVRADLLRFLGNKPPTAYMNSAFAIPGRSIDQALSNQVQGKIVVKGGVGWLVPDEGTEVSVDEQMSNLLDDVKRAEALPELLRRRASELESREPVNDLSIKKPPKSTESNVKKQLDESRVTSNSAIEEVARLTRANEELEDELKRTQGSLSALRRSKLGRIQVAVWKRRKGLHSLPASTTNGASLLKRKLSRELTRWSKGRF
ncbi:glycosyltransferase family 4 protein [Corynebacterium sp. HMSC071B10]|uniref:glycosyltransferase family 4 protein n=1 Tax=Corynebacterium sp. HMSC071B10 TaxID=1739494 RepID=UPI000B13CE84|nr:glycosyltransferase family 4 protein [Corynebacterium sp. HMSC071B10]